MTKCLPLTDPDNLWSFCPSTPAAVLFTALFGITTVVHTFQASKFRATFCWTIIMGGAWETISFAIRIISIRNPTSQGPYTPWFLLFLLAPLWINAFDYMLLGRMVFQYLPNQKLLGIRAKRMALLFVVLDVASFIIQIGGGIMVTSKNENTKKMGLHIYTGGLVLQEAFILFFLYLVVTFQRRLKKEATLEERRDAKRLLLFLYITLTLISLRVIYRILEFADYNSALTKELWFKEAYQYGLDAAPMFLALIAGNILHVGTVIPGNKNKFIPIPGRPVELNNKVGNGYNGSSEGVVYNHA
ncbi:Uncharacterized protein BP5553_00250 [Venustampulla echinocandica]|uniref:RTA1-domain-containing protein n=1 Tax=Venustampulla echinocandica TaxID=2656787 RepID=A0A370TXL7_9HELO|nr:Uncharacterized protein BP5553_00250 [Venustampulla echinocandica]RDL40271.1 Uncharacterized protein BP5553_00250 [Venustampulla echinocandica]